VLGLLAAAAITVEVWFNLQQQLRPEELAQARRLWDEKGPRDYVLDYAVKREHNPEPGGSVPEQYTVTVRGGRALPSGGHEFGSMDDLFDQIEKQLRADREAGGRRPFVKAVFDEHDGHIVHYVHSVMSTRERLEIAVRLRRE
jgi:hypothetical protein